MASAIGGIVASVVGNIVSNLVGGMISSLVSQLGGSNVFGALGNMIMSGVGDVIKGAIQNAPIPQFLKDAATSLVDKVLENNKMETTPEAEEAVSQSPEAQDAVENAKTATAKQISEETEGKEGGNWLVALAGALAKVQGKFLQAAMDNMKTMEENAGKTGSSGDDKKASNEFLIAQSEYQANMQMFNMMANASATSLKSIGEGLTALARKQ